MKNGLAIWHYPHRTPLDNVRFFAENGFESVSMIGIHVQEICADEKKSEELYRLIRDYGLTLTVHYKLPDDHSEKSVASFKEYIEAIAGWQRKYGALSILSFDVYDSIRDNMAAYVDYVLDTVPSCKVAVEDFGLNADERRQTEHLKANDRFGYLIDIGHMYLRLCGKNTEGKTLFTNSPDECPAAKDPSLEDFLKAFSSKEFPVFEIHLHNNDGVGDMHYFLDDGTLDIGMIAELLKRVGFDGVLTIESAPGFQFKCEYPESDRRILETYGIWKKYMR